MEQAGAGVDLEEPMSRSAVEVRRAAVADAGPLVELVEGLRAEATGAASTGASSSGSPGGGPEGRDDSRRRLLSALGRDDLDLLVAWAGDRPVGLAVVRRGETVPLHGDDALHVDHLAVHARFRRRGVAGTLLAAVVAAADAAGCLEVTCATPAGHREANRFLARLGFAPAVTHRVTPTAVLRRQLARRSGNEARTTVQQVLVRRRLQRGRVRGAADGSTGSVALPGASD